MRKTLKFHRGKTGSIRESPRIINMVGVNNTVNFCNVPIEDMVENEVWDMLRREHAQPETQCNAVDEEPQPRETIHPKAKTIDKWGAKMALFATLSALALGTTLIINKKTK